MKKKKFPRQVTSFQVSIPSVTCCFMYLCTTIHQSSPSWAPSFPSTTVPPPPPPPVSQSTSPVSSLHCPSFWQHWHVNYGAFTSNNQNTPITNCWLIIGQWSRLPVMVLLPAVWRTVADGNITSAQINGTWYRWAGYLAGILMLSFHFASVLYSFVCVCVCLIAYLQLPRGFYTNGGPSSSLSFLSYSYWKYQSVNAFTYVFTCFSFAHYSIALEVVTQFSLTLLLLTVPCCNLKWIGSSQFKRTFYYLRHQFD